MALLALLYGSLFPSPIEGVSPVLMGGVLAAPLVLWEFLRALPDTPRGSGFAIGLCLLLIAHPLLFPPETTYGDGKLERLYTVTPAAILAVLLIRDRATVVTFARLWLVGSVALAAVTVAGYQPGDRSAGFEDADAGPIGVAQMLAVGVVIAVWLAWERLRWRLVALPAVVLLTAGVFATGSRGPLAAAVIAVAALALAKERAVGRVYLLTVLTTGAAVALVYVDRLRYSRIGDLFFDPTSDLALTYRGMLWGEALAAIPENPGGVGLGNYAYETPAFALWPHNLFLEVFVEHGWIVGAVFLVAVVRVLIRVSRRCRGGEPETRLLLALLVTQLLYVSVSGDLSAARPMLAFLVMAYAIVLSRRDASSRPDEAVVPKDRLERVDLGLQLRERRT